MNSLIRKSATPFGALVIAVIFLIAMAVIAISNVTHADNGAIPQRGRLITIHDGDTEKVILSQASAIGDAIKEAGITIDSKDMVEPAVTEKLVASDYQVNIYRARPVIIVDGNVRQKIITPHQTAEQIATDAGITLYPEDKTTIDRVDNLADGAGLQLTIDRATPITFVLYGKTTTVRTHATTVGDMLKEKGINLAADDVLSVSIAQPIVSGETVELWRNGKQTINVDEDIPFDTQQIQNADQSVGYKLVQTVGVVGKKTTTYEVEMKNGVEINRISIQSVVITEPKQQIEVVGTKNNYSGSLNEWLTALRTCETNGSYVKNTGNGFYGAYQFMISTWNSTASKIGRSDLVGVRPDMANSADQDMLIVVNTKLSSGGLATQNPGCYKKLGLSQFPPN